MTDEEMCRLLRDDRLEFLEFAPEIAARIEALRAERDAWQQECELRTEDYQRAYRREMDNAARAALAPVEAKGENDARP